MRCLKQGGEQIRKKFLVQKVQELEDQLKSSNLQLVETKKQFDETQKQMAKREFDFANTIQSLEEDAQMAQKYFVMLRWGNFRNSFC